MPGSIGEHFRVLAVPIERQRQPLFKANLRLPPRKAVELGGIDVLAINLSLGYAGAANVGCLLKGGDPAERVDHVDRSPRHTTASIECLAGGGTCIKQIEHREVSIDCVLDV